MKNTHWFIFFVMLLHLSCGGNTTPVEDRAEPSESEVPKEQLPSSENDVATEQEINQSSKPVKPEQTQLPSSDTIFLEDGILNGYEIKITQSGSEGNPIVLTARNPGKTIITGNVNIEVSGSHVYVRDLIFKNIQPVGKNVGVIKFTGEHCTMFNCLIYNTENFKIGKTCYWVTIDGKENRIERNTFVGKNNKGPLVYIVAEDSNKGDHEIAKNLFARIKPLGANGLSAIRIGLKTETPVNSRTLVRENIFHECDGEIELISSKSSKNLIVDNMFSESRGGVTLRWGDDCKVSNNLFISSKNTSIGVRVAGSEHKIVYNTFNLVGGPNAAAIVLMAGSANAECGYQPAKDIDIHDNQFYGNAAWKVLEQINCDEMPQFIAKDNFRFAKGRSKGVRCDYSVDNRTVSEARKGNSKILKEIYEIKALDGEGEKSSVSRIDAPDLSGFVKMESNEAFLIKWRQINPQLGSKGVGSTLRVPGS